MDNLIVRKIDNKYHLYSTDYFKKEVLMEGKEKVVYKQNKKYYWKLEIDTVSLFNKDKTVIRFYDNEPNEANKHLFNKGLGSWVFLQHSWELKPVEKAENEWKTWMPVSFLKILKKW